MHSRARTALKWPNAFSDDRDGQRIKHDLEQVVSLLEKWAK